MKIFIEKLKKILWKIVTPIGMVLILLFLTSCSTDTNDAVYVTGIDGLATIEYEHYEIHEGDHFYISNFEVINDGANVTFAVTTPNTTKWAHMTFMVSGTSQTEMYVYEGSSVTGGAATTPFNNDRNSATTSTLTIVKNPTVTAYGTEIYAQSAGLAGTTPAKADVSGLHDRDREIILDQNTTTTFVIVSRDDGNIVSYNGEWYEHTFP